MCPRARSFFSIQGKDISHLCSKGKQLGTGFFNSRFDLKYVGVRHYDAVINHEQLEEHTDRVLQIIDREVKLLNGNYSKIMVGGFCQGACVAYNTLLKSKNKLGGIIALSGFVTPKLKVEDVSEVVLDTPIYSFHGLDDDIIPETVHRWGAAFLKDLGCR
jgi:phospholipase/carboxylesterase